ncbi:PH domain-containing protein [Candidatus Nitronereus thalassa]|uniref:PH domain-containing protein n=1 Tax=Candidatus Nitronereus thalassa TaxID=3020898 RepID=A0ABU3K7G8_9BACT|nr:PH domain-containing protein [Candidatus Nitronereus thalassa]MDT7042385.1 PH domain-containing protein [Candidatus Nitronereus thalassa]
MLDSTTKGERILWKAYPSWKHFTWLYLFSALSALRAGLFLYFGIPTWEMWIAGAIFLLSCVFVIRHWARYFVTSAKVEIKNGYTGKEIDAINLEQIRDISIQQGFIAGKLGIGTLVIQDSGGDRRLQFRGVRDPEVIKARIDALRPPLDEEKEGLSP